MINRSTTATPFYQQLESRIQELGGMFNAHLHLDRAGTLDEYYWGSSRLNVLETSYISLLEKHAFISNLHGGPAYETGDLELRITEYLETMISVNTFRADTFVDVTLDNVGLSAMNTMLKIKHARADEIDLRVGAYSPFGYKDSDPQRWDLLVEGAQHSDFIGSLPEADDIDDYPEHIGFYEHCKRMLLLGQELNKELHVHIDQRNEPTESGTEQLIRAVRKVGSPQPNPGEPGVWAIHVISPSTYDEARFKKLLEGLVECNIGVICCPSAAIGMRQLRPLLTPTYNSFPRLLEMIAAGVHVRMGCDNMADICSPSTTADLIDEVFVLSAATRFYNIDILSKIAAGLKLDEDDREFIKHHLYKNDIEIKRIINGNRSRVNSVHE